MARPRTWTDHLFEVTSRIATSTTEFCWMLGVQQNGPQVACLRRHAERLQVPFPSNPKHGDGREREPAIVPLPLLRAAATDGGDQ